MSREFADVKGPDHAIEPDRVEMRAFLEWLTRDWGTLVEPHVLEVSAIPAEGGQREQASFRVDDIEQAVDWATAKNQRGLNAYVVVNPKAAHASDRCASDDDIISAFFQFADGDEPQSVKALSTSEASGVVFTGTQPHRRIHVYWRLTELATDLVAWRSMQQAIVRTFGADKQCVNPARLMRLPGSVSYPSTKKASKGYVTELVTSTLNAAAFDEIAGVDAASAGRKSHQSTKRARGSTRSPHRDRDLLELLATRRNTFPSTDMSETDAWKNINDRSAWLRLIFGVHAAFYGTEWEEEARTEIVEFSSRWENVPSSSSPDLYAAEAAKVWDSADPVGEVGPATAYAILSDLPVIGPGDVAASPPSSTGVSPTQSDEPPICLTGLAGELAELVRGASKRHVEVIPIAGALMSMSALASRFFTIKGPEGEAPLNIFGLVLADTGVGKEAVRQVLRSVLRTAGRVEEFLDSVASDRALHLALGDRNGNVALAIDEAGLSLDALRKGTQPHQRALVTFAMKLFGLGLDELSEHAYADRKKKLSAVSKPRLTMLWTSTPAAFENATGQADSESGQMNRFVVFRERGLPDLKPAGATNRDKVRELPERVEKAVRFFSAKLLLDRAQDNGTSAVIRMTDKAVARLREFENGEVEERIKEGGSTAESWSRAVEQALRVAGLLAVSDAAANLDEQLADVVCEYVHVDLAMTIIRRGLTETVEVVRRAGRSETEQRKDDVLAAIEKYADADGWARARDVHRHGALRGMRKRDRKDLIDAMIEDAEIVASSRKTGGRSGDVYGIAVVQDPADCATDEIDLSATLSSHKP